MRPTVRILGTHGVPASYGGFETAAQNVGLHLVARGWRVVVYCQRAGTGQISEDEWNGIERVIVPVRRTGWLGTSEFDLRTIRHASRFKDVCLTFGYNTAVLNLIQRFKRIPNVVNMDGLEWSRKRWGLARQAILYVNERIACRLGATLIADHPEIARHLATRAPEERIMTITYGADAIESAPEEILEPYGLKSQQFLTLICRPIPENSILALIQGFSRCRRDLKLVVLGDYRPDVDEYHRQVVEAASDEVIFLGACYDQDKVRALRFHSLLYLHGHTVGGTNPSLVEAMAAGNPVIAHDNVYNRWVAKDAAVYFRSADDVVLQLDALLKSPDRLVAMGRASRERHAAHFRNEHIGDQYERVLRQCIAGSRPVDTRRRRTLVTVTGEAGDD